MELKWVDPAYVYLPSTRNMLFFHSLFSYPWFLRYFLFFVQSGHHRTIQYLIPGRTTKVELLKQLKNWQIPSWDLWSNCLIHFPETTKGQINYYYSGLRKDNSKTICGRAGYRLIHSDINLKSRRSVRDQLWRRDTKSNLTRIPQKIHRTKGDVIAIFLKHRISERNDPDRTNSDFLDRSSYSTYDDTMFNKHTHENTVGDRIETSSDRLGNACSTLSSVSICNRSVTSSMYPNCLISRSDDEEIFPHISNTFDRYESLSALSRMYPMILWFLDPSMNLKIITSVWGCSDRRWHRNYTMLSSSLFFVMENETLRWSSTRHGRRTLRHRIWRVTDATSYWFFSQDHESCCRFTSVNIVIGIF